MKQIIGNAIIPTTVELLKDSLQLIEDSERNWNEDRWQQSIPLAIESEFVLSFMTTASMESFQEHTLTVQHDSTINN